MGVLVCLVCLVCLVSAAADGLLVCLVSAVDGLLVYWSPQQLICLSEYYSFYRIFKQKSRKAKMVLYGNISTIV